MKDTLPFSTYLLPNFHVSLSPNTYSITVSDFTNKMFHWFHVEMPRHFSLRKVVCSFRHEEDVEEKEGTSTRNDFSSVEVLDSFTSYAS